MNGLAIHPLTRNEIDQFVKHTSHALALVGPVGVGKMSVAHIIGRQLLGQDISAHPYARFVVPDNQTISIDAIRELQNFLKLKLPSKKLAIGRLVVIERAEYMTHEAQNALLKMLEEPPANTLIILTVSAEQALLPTIRSRIQRISVRQPSSESLFEHFEDAGHSRPVVEQAYLLTGGLPGIMQAILQHDDTHELVQTAAKVRELLAAQPFQRLVIADSLSKQKNETAHVLFMMQHMARAALERVALNNEDQAAKHWNKVLKAAYDTESALQVNAQPKLALLNLMLSL